MVVLYRRMDEVLNFFDLDCVCVGYNGKNVFGLPRSIRALQTGYNIVSLNRFAFKSLIIQ